MIQSDQDEIGEINVTPFIDVMLVLLIIFMVAAPLSTVDIPVDLPQSSAAATPRPDQAIWLTITETGEWVLGQAPVSRDSLGPALTAAIAEKAAGVPAGAAPAPIYLRADHRLDYGAVVAAMNALAGLGHTRVALVTEEAVP